MSDRVPETGPASGIGTPHPTHDFAGWRAAILDASDIVQDGDDTVAPEEAERRFNRFIALIDQVQGGEADEVFLTLMETLTDQEDYGAYQSVLGALHRFGPDRRGRLVAEGIVPLLRRAAEQAGDVLGQLAFAEDAAITAFNRACPERLAADERAELARFIAEQEHGDGWLDNDAQRGRLRVG